MSDVSTSAAAPAAPSSTTGTDIVRGSGHAPGQGLGEAMPDVPQGVQAARPSEFKKIIAQRQAAAKQQPTARGKVAEFSAKLEARQQAPVQPTEPRTARETKTENMGDPNQLKEPGSIDPNDGQIELDDSQRGEVVTDEQELERVAAITDQDALQKFREWEQGDMFPEELEAKLHELKANGVTRYVDTKELKQGYIRGVDYRRFHAEAQAVSQRAERQQESMQQHFAQIRDPEQMLEIYERNGYGETLFEVAKLIGQRYREDQQLVEAAGLAVMQRRGINDWNHREVVDAMKNAEARVKQMRVNDIEARRVTFEKQQLEAERQAQQSQVKTQEHYAHYEAQLNQLRPLVFRAYGLPDNKANRAGLLKHLGAVINEQGMPPTGLSRELLMTAGRDLAEELESERSGRPPVGLTPEQWQRLQAQQGARGGGRELPPQRLGGGGGKPLGVAGSGQERGRLSDLVNMVNKGRMRQ